MNNHKQTLLRCVNAMALVLIVSNIVGCVSPKNKLVEFHDEGQYDEYLKVTRPEGISSRPRHLLDLEVSNERLGNTDLIGKIALQSVDFFNSNTVDDDLPDYKVLDGLAFRSANGRITTIKQSTPRPRFLNFGYDSFPSKNDCDIKYYEDRSCVEVRVSLKGASENCFWEYDNRSVQISSCVDVPAAVKNGELAISVSFNGHKKTKKITPFNQEVLFVGLGDSYSSGEGMGYWEDVGCRRSIIAWPALVAARYALENPDTEVKYRSVACSGATTSNILVGRLNGDSHHIPEKSQLELLRRSLCGYTSKDELRYCVKHYDDVYIMLSAGGNDVGFGEILVDALLGSVEESGTDDEFSLDDDTVSKIHHAIETSLPENYKLIASNLLNSFPSANVYVTSYPSLIHKNNTELCGTTHFSENDQTLTLTSGEINAIHNSVIKPFYGDLGLPKIISSAVDGLSDSKRSRWHFVPMSKLEADSTALAPNYGANGFCRDGEGVNGPWFRIYSESLERIGQDTGTAHPNLLGQLYYAHRVYNGMFKNQLTPVKSSF